jgi:SAM-dependent methyltransferase
MAVAALLRSAPLRISISVTVHFRLFCLNTAVLLPRMRKRDREAFSDTSQPLNRHVQGASEGHSEALSIDDRSEAENYSSRKYWDRRYKDIESEDHEWYYSFDSLEPILSQTRPLIATDAILEIGCGNRPLVQNFRKFGIESGYLYAIDFSSKVIDDIKAEQDFQGFHIECMDARKLTYVDDQFAMIVEKGTIDAMLSAKVRKIGIKNALKLLTEAVRVMALDGAMVIVSHIKADSDDFEVLMNEIVVPALSTKLQVNWDVKAHSVKERSSSDNNSSSTYDRYGTVYAIRSIPRRATRNARNGSGSINFEVLEYSESESDSEEDVDGGLFTPYCQPCAPKG